MGRPKTNPEKHRQNVAITLDPGLLSQARKLSAANGKSLSQVIENLLRNWILQVAIKQSGPPIRPEHLKIISDAGWGTELEAIMSDLSDLVEDHGTGGVASAPPPRMSSEKKVAMAARALGNAKEIAVQRKTKTTKPAGKEA